MENDAEGEKYKATLKMLLDAERKSRERTENAKENARLAIEEAHRVEAERIEEARRKARAEADVLLEEARESARGRRIEVRSMAVATALQDQDVLRRNAQKNMKQAVDYLVSWATGETE